MQGMEELAHAKVNLFLRVLRRREDGFHEIETLIAPITLHDSLVIESARCDCEFYCDQPGLAGDDNLVVRAARLFFPKQIANQKSGLRFGKKFPTVLVSAAAVAMRLQPCAGSTASSMPGFRMKH